MSALIDVRVSIRGIEQVQRLLANYQEPGVTQLLKLSTREGAKVFRRAVKASIRTRLGKRRGNLLAATRYRAIRRSKGIGYVIGPMGRKGSHRHLVEFGHDLTFRKKRDGGKVVGKVPPHPYIAPAFAESEAAAAAAAEAVITAALDAADQP